MIGKSTCGSADTGICRYPINPHNNIANAMSVVATGRRMNGDETFIINFYRLLFNVPLSLLSGALLRPGCIHRYRIVRCPSWLPLPASNPMAGSV
jgi:hypothetical protein